MRRIVLLALWVGLLSVGAGCGSGAAASSDTAMAADASVSLRDKCLAGTVSIQDFVDLGWCRSQYADASGTASCTVCAGYRIVGKPMQYQELDCFYDEHTGALVGGWYWTDDAPSCAAGTAHKECGGIAYPPGSCPDAGGV